MAQSPSTDNYTLGKGVVYFDQLSAGVYMGSRDLGNAPEFSFNIALEKLEHFSSRGGLKAKDKQVISQITPACKFTLDEVNVDNIGLLTLGDVVVNSTTQAANGYKLDEVLTFRGDKRSDLTYRNVGLYTLGFTCDTGGTLPAVGSTVTDGTGAGEVAAAVFTTGDTAGTLTLVLTTPGFTAGTLTNTGLTNALSTGAEVFVSGLLAVNDTALLAGTVYVAGTDYSVSPNTALKDAKIGRVLWDSGSAMAEGDTVYVSYNYLATTWSEIRAFNQTSLEGRLRFVSDNPVGGQQELTIWRCNLTPAGDTAMIGEDWSTLSFEGEILKDESNTDSPYMTFIIE